MIRLNKTVYITGLGGQGVIVFGNILADLAHKSGYKVKQLQTINLAMRLGQVQTTVKFGEKVYSPMAMKDSCDYIIAFEKLEALRSIDFLKDGGTIFINDLEIKPMSEVIGLEKYPKNIIELINKKTKNIHLLNANNAAEQIGNSKTMNIVMLGAVSNILKLTGYEEILKEHVPAKFYDLNIKAFELGKQLIKS